MKIKFLSRSSLILILTSIGLLTSGCYTRHHVSNSGTDFNIQDVKLIKPGKTTKDEVLQLFGKPWSKHAMQAGPETWHYAYSRMSHGMFRPATMHSKSFSVTFKKDVVDLCHVTYNEGSHIGAGTSTVPCDQYE